MAGARKAPAAPPPSAPQEARPDLAPPQEAPGAALHNSSAAAVPEQRSVEGARAAAAVTEGSAQPGGAAAADAAGLPEAQTCPARGGGMAAGESLYQKRLPGLRKHLEEVGKAHLLPQAEVPGWQASGTMFWWRPGAARCLRGYAPLVKHLEGMHAAAQGAL